MGNVVTIVIITVTTFTMIIVVLCFQSYQVSVVAVVPLPPQKFVHPPHCYYQLKKNKKFKFKLASEGITFISNFIKIRLGVLESKHADRRTNVTIRICCPSCILRKEGIIIIIQLNSILYSLTCWTQQPMAIIIIIIIIKQFISILCLSAHSTAQRPIIK
jgi:hypothetical protein